MLTFAVRFQGRSLNTFFFDPLPPKQVTEVYFFTTEKYQMI